MLDCGWNTKNISLVVTSSINITFSEIVGLAVVILADSVPTSNNAMPAP